MDNALKMERVRLFWKGTLTFSSSLASPTSRCLASAPEPLVSGAPAAALHGDAMVPAASAPLAETNERCYCSFLFLKH